MSSDTTDANATILRDVEEMVRAVKLARIEGPYCLIYKGNTYEVVDGIAYLNGKRVDFITDLDEHEERMIRAIHKWFTPNGQVL